MIYTKGKVGHYMGNTDILTTSLPDADRTQHDFRRCIPNHCAKNAAASHSADQ